MGIRRLIRVHPKPLALSLFFKNGNCEVCFLLPKTARSPKRERRGSGPGNNQFNMKHTSIVCSRLGAHLRKTRGTWRKRGCETLRVAPLALAAHRAINGRYRSAAAESERGTLALSLTASGYLRGRSAWRDLNKPNPNRLTNNRLGTLAKDHAGAKGWRLCAIAGTRAARHMRVSGKQQRRETACSVGVEWPLRMLRRAWSAHLLVRSRRMRTAL